MFELKKFCVFFLILSFLGSAFGADIILNEYNAVSNTMFLNGGNASADSDGGRASDSYFGRVQGNGGDWFELVVITDHLDVRNWKLDIYDDGVFTETLTLTNHIIWSDLRSGTIITVSEDLQSDVSYNPAAGDWWINVQANNAADGLYITASNFVVSNKNWQLIIRDAGGNIKFGPAGEGVSPASGIGDTEIFRLEATPSALITPNSTDYDSGKSLSTFGSANQWSGQDLYRLYNDGVVAGLSLLSPNGSEIMMSGTTHTITWNTTGAIADVIIMFSVDNGNNWSEVDPPNAGNTGSYNWLVPTVNSQQCKVCVMNADYLNIYDITDGLFTIYECTLDGDLTNDCFINMDDFVIMASNWLQEGNPYN